MNKQVKKANFIKININIDEDPIWIRTIHKNDIPKNIICYYCENEKIENRFEILDF